ncbi:hypothetical protein K9M47_04560 [Candidatus Gracilibacteria bacterium]|nr:hypothetical protein [Candidatus Gracilibacteria bacterium]MCF7898956.1 hypothetical protein [Candidatus Paceibacterota bacterium]
MKEIKTTTIEKALLMYAENVSPSQENLKAILSHIPEQKIEKRGRAIRSPYIWVVAVTEFVTIFCIVFAVSISLTSTTGGEATQNPFYAIDMQVVEFEVGIEMEDYKNSLKDYTL